jgi:hypothetical protein
MMNAALSTRSGEIKAMKSETKLGLILGGILLVLGLAVSSVMVGFMLFRTSSATQKARADFKKQTAETVGSVTNVSLSSMSKTFTYKFDVNGTTYSGEWSTTRNKVEENYREKVGKKGIVCYDPSDPNNSDFYYSEFYEYGSKKGERMVCGVSPL